LCYRFFNEVVRDNSGRAVRGEPPLDFEKARAKWQRIVASVCPQSSFISSAITGQMNKSEAGSQRSGGAGQRR